MILRSLFGGDDASPAPAMPLPRLPRPRAAGTRSRSAASPPSSRPCRSSSAASWPASPTSWPAWRTRTSRISPVELAYMEHAVVEVGHLSAGAVGARGRDGRQHERAVRRHGRLRRDARSSPSSATREQREDLLRTAFAVGAADDTITAAEVGGAQRGRQGAGLPLRRGGCHPRRVPRPAHRHPGHARGPRSLRPHAKRGLRCWRRCWRASFVPAVALSRPTSRATTVTDLDTPVQVGGSCIGGAWPPFTA